MRGNLTILVKVCYGFGVIGVKMVGLMGQGGNEEQNVRNVVQQR